MNTQIVIFLIAAVFQANAAVPFLNGGKNVLGGLQQIGNNVVNQGKDIIEKGKEQIEEARETIENFPNVIEENVQNVISQGQNVLEEAKEHIHDVHEAVGDISPEDISNAIQENLPGIPISPEDIFEIADEFNQLHTAACDALSSSFNIQNTLCKQIKDIFRNQAKIITDQISRIIHSVQGRIVNLIERGQAVPPKTLDVIEKSTNEAINKFEKMLTFFRAPKAFTEKIIPFLRETTETNVEIAREYVSYLAGSNFGNIIEEIKNSIGGGVPTQIAVQNAFQTNIQEGISKFEEIRNQLQGRLETLQNSATEFGSAVQSQIVQQISQIENVMEQVKEKYQDNMKNVMDKVSQAAKEIQNINLNDFAYQSDAQEMIQNAISNVQENFQEQLQNAIKIPNHPEIKEQIQGIFKNPFQDLQAEIGKIVYHIMNEIVNRIKDQIGSVAAILSEVDNNNGVEFDSEAEQADEEAAFRPNPGASFGGGSAGGLTGTWDDPNRIFYTLI